MHESNDIHSNPSQKLQIHIAGSKNKKCVIFQKDFFISKITHSNISKRRFFGSPTSGESFHQLFRQSIQSLHKEVLEVQNSSEPNYSYLDGSRRFKARDEARQSEHSIFMYNKKLDMK